MKLGIIPAVISPFALAKIGPSWARRYFVTGERFDAATALRIGLVHEVAADLDAAVERVLAELRSAGPRAARHAKRLVLDRPDGPETARRIAERRTSDEGQEGLRAFLERRSRTGAKSRERRADDSPAGYQSRNFAPCRARNGRAEEAARARRARAADRAPGAVPELAAGCSCRGPSPGRTCPHTTVRDAGAGHLRQRELGSAVRELTLPPAVM